MPPSRKYKRLIYESDPFPKRLIYESDPFPGTPYGGEAIRQHNEEQAERLIAKALGLLGLEEADLEKLAKNSPEKYALAWPLRRHTGVKVSWIKQRLKMGKATSFSSWLKKLEPSRKGQWGYAAFSKIQKINL